MYIYILYNYYFIYYIFLSSIATRITTPAPDRTSQSKKELSARMIIALLETACCLQ